MKASYDRRRKLICGLLNEIPLISCRMPKGAFYAFVNIKALGVDDETFCMDLLHKKGIVLVPGSGFDWPQPDHFRVVMLPEAKDLARAMTDVGEFLQTYRQ